MFGPSMILSVPVRVFLGKIRVQFARVSEAEGSLPLPHGLASSNQLKGLSGPISWISPRIRHFLADTL